MSVYSPFVQSLALVLLSVTPDWVLFGSGLDRKSDSAAASRGRHMTEELISGVKLEDLFQLFLLWSCLIMFNDLVPVNIFSLEKHPVIKNRAEQQVMVVHAGDDLIVSDSVWDLHSGVTHTVKQDVDGD